MKRMFESKLHAAVRMASRLMRRFLVGFLAGLVPVIAAAAPGELADYPLFLGRLVQPNILFLMDDSSSMNGELLHSSEAVEIHSGFRTAGILRFDIEFDHPEEVNEFDLLEHCPGFNVLAYDPRFDYVPWAGKDHAGNVFADQPVTAALANPYTDRNLNAECDDNENGEVDNTNGSVCNLLDEFNDHRGNFYIEWVDDGDGIFESGECKTANPVFIKDHPDQQQNYANWFSYYRKRQYVMKRAMSEVIQASVARVGLATINRTFHLYGRSSVDGSPTGIPVGTPIKNIDDITLPLNPAAALNKAKLIDNLLGSEPLGITPLVTATRDAGEYFMGNSSAVFGFVPPDDPDSAHGYSPILKADLGGVCQQNFLLILSDGAWNDLNLPPVGNTDADGPGEFDGQSYGDTASNTLADVAMHYYETDLNADLANEVPSTDILRGVDDNPQQHLVTFAIAFGVTGTIPETDPQGNQCIPPNREEDLVTQNWPTICDDNPDPSSRIAPGWPSPSRNSPTTIDDMMHAAWNGRGLFLPAKDPDQLFRQLQAALGDAASRQPPAAAAVAVDTYNIINGGLLFQGKFDSSNWSGDINARNLDVNGVADNFAWASSAGEQLALRDFNTRVMISYNGQDGVIFQFPEDYRAPAADELSLAQVGDLLTDAPFPLDTADLGQINENQAYGVRITNYLRGDFANEGEGINQFRSRDGLRLGDIIGSSPVYVADPDPLLYPETIAPASYQAWASENGAKGRLEMLYVGANDGALHGFYAGEAGAGKPNPGEEVFAYFPHSVFSNAERDGLHWLADQSYEHRYYVDIEPDVQEVYVDTGDGVTKWRTLLVGGLRGGGRGIYALDVSDPEAFRDPATATQKVLWEFTHDNLGYTYSKPTIVKMNDGRWAAVFGNGYNQGSAASSGEASLFIKYLDNAIPTYREISTKTGSIANGDCADAASDCNGLATPALVDLGGDRVVDRIYAGDAKGNLWAFDLSSADPANWKVAYGTIDAPVPLYSSLNSAGSAQPISSRPVVTLHPTKRHSSTAPNILVFFGTGQYITASDPLTNAVQSFYGLWDRGSAITGQRSNVLVEQTITLQTNAITTVDGETKDVRLLTNNPVVYDETTGPYGWYVNLPDPKERVVVNPLIFGDLVVYTTLVPKENLCSISSGSSWLMVHNYVDGSEPDITAIDVSGDGVFNGQDQVEGINVGGVKSGSLYWQPTIVKSGEGSIGTLLLPTDNEEAIDTELIQGATNKGERASWGRYRFE